MNPSDRSRARTFLDLARTALNEKNTARARALAGEAARLDPRLEEAWLILAAFSPPEDSIAFLKRALEINPHSQRARQGMHWAAARLREQPAPEDTGPVRPAPAPPETTARGAVAPRPEGPGPVRARTAARRAGHFSAWLAAGLVVVLGVMLLLVAPVANLAKAHYSAQPRAAGDLAKPSLTPTGTVTRTPTASATFTATATPLPTLTSTPTDIPTRTPKPTRKPRPTATEDPPLPEEPEPIEIPATGQERWVDVDLTNQTASAYEGDQVVRSFVVSTGTYEHPTVTGQYNIYVKYRYADMLGPGYYLPDVPYVMYFYKGYGLHGTYWHNNFGTPMSHGCVNFTIDDAGWLFEFTSVGTLVNVHY